MKNLLRSLSLPEMKVYFLLVFFCFCISNIFGQNKTITGTVTDANNQPVPGVSVLVKGTATGAATDFDGKYSVNASTTDVLVFSYIGFVSQEIAVSNLTTISVILQEDISQLNEVVVIGYGSQRRSEIAGAVSTIKTEEIQASPTANISNALVGRTAGIIAVQRTGDPGNDASEIYIRGVGTTGDSSPLYVIDGIVRSARAFNQLNSDEIESFSVLKDASSAAVFGVRGGNGVVLVTTKRGKAGKMNIKVSTELGVQERTRDPKLLGSYEYAQLVNEARVNEGNPPLFTQADLDAYRDHTNLDTHPDTDWFSVLSKAPQIRRYDISANGGSEAVKFATSFGFLNQEGIVPTNRHKRYNFRSNIDANVTKTTKFVFDVSGRSEDTRTVEEPELFRWLISAKPNLAPIQFSNGGYSSGPAYLAVPENGYRNRKIQNFSGRLEIVQELPIEGLSLKGVASYVKNYNNQKNFKFPKIPFYTINADGTSFTEQPPGKKELYQDHREDESITLEAHLMYDNTFGKNAVSGLVLYTQTEDQGDFLQGYRDGYTLAIDELAFGGVENRTNWGSSSSGGRQGIVGRVGYTFDDKYKAEFSFRADGSEQFAPGKRWGFFPSGSLAYTISKESFFKVPAIDNLKLRASYGILGNDRIGGARFLYLQSFLQGGNAVFGDGDVQPVIYEGGLPSPDVTWEQVEKEDYGFDITLWKGLLSVTFDYFNEQRSDILGQRNLTVPSLLGIGLPVVNLGRIRNKGIEVSLGHSNTINEDLSYSLNGNFTYARSKVLYIDEPVNESNPNVYQTGRPIWSQFGYHSLGLFQTQEEVDNWATQGANTAPGDIRYEDVNGDGKIDDNDRVFIGSSNLPEIIFGLNGNVRYKDFQLSFLLQGATNVNQYYAGEAAWPFFLTTSGAYEENLDRWTPTNTDASEPRVKWDDQGWNHAGSDFWLRDATYVRLKNVELAYNVPVKQFAGTFIQGIRIYANANNVYTWTKIKNFDPENGDGRAWGYPQMRIWNFGVDFNF